jgi:hypothetical protein
MNNTRYVQCIKNKDYEIDLTVGQVYKVVPLAANEKNAGVIRIIDNESEDYLYDVDYFDPFEPNSFAVSSQKVGGTPTRPLGFLKRQRSFPRNIEQVRFASHKASLTIHLDAFTKGVLYAEALAADKSMSALVREWIDERLDLAAY